MTLNIPFLDKLVVRLLESFAVFTAERPIVTYHYGFGVL
jgi:hypothetical protein